MNALKTRNKTKCEKCLEKIKKEAEKQIIENTLENEYKYFEEFKQTSGENLREYDFTLFFAALFSEGMDTEFCKRVFDKAVMYSSVSEMLGKKLTMEDFSSRLKEMGLDFNRIEYHQETLESYKKRYWEEYPYEEFYKENNND